MELLGNYIHCDVNFIYYDPQKEVAGLWSKNCGISINCKKGKTKLTEL